ncbi:superoxide dismutase [Streptomyces sp. NPDC006458]|uniref:superoxide dismutase n=1 Tax=Streptomyces sp. NPDC006458 TaxID=3154302 RepID=UPI0033B616F0
MTFTNRSLTRRNLFTATAALSATALVGGTAHATGATRHSWPTRLQLPGGWRPEGITLGHGPHAYVGSLAHGDLYRVSLATGRGRVVPTGLGSAHPTAGLKSDRYGRLFVSGATSGELRTVDARTGEVERIVPVGGAFVNDVILTPGAAWFTDSFKAVLYRLELGPRNVPGEAVTVPLGGDWEQGTDFTGNGIARTPDGSALLVVNAFADGGRLMRVDPRTGLARAVDLGDARIPNGDGILLLGRTLYVVQQFQNRVDVFRLNAAGTRGSLVTVIQHEGFRIPTAAAAWGDRLYLPNARFDVAEPTADTDYDVVAVAQI